MHPSLKTPLLVTPRVPIETAYIDYNGHLNAGYYYVIFDKALDEALIPLGLGPEYIKQRNLSIMTLEAHVGFLREAVRTDPLRATVRLIEVDAKRVHSWTELVHETEGWVAAYAEAMHIHVDMGTRRSSPWPDDIRANLDRVARQQTALPRPERTGRAIGMPGKGGMPRKG